MGHLQEFIHSPAGGRVLQMKLPEWCVFGAHVWSFRQWLGPVHLPQQVPRTLVTHHPQTQA